MTGGIARVVVALVLLAGCGRTSPLSEYAHSDDERADRPGESTGDGGSSSTDSGFASGAPDGGTVVDGGLVPDAGAPRDAGPPPELPVEWEPPAPVPGLNTPFDDMHPTMTEDLLRICFASNRLGSYGGTLDIWCAERSTPAGHFSSAVNQDVNSWGIDTTPSLSADGAQLYFASNVMGGTGGLDLYVASWDPQLRRYVRPVALEDLNTDVHESGPAVSRDGLTLYFNSTRRASRGRENIFVATRDTLTLPFLAPVFEIFETSSPLDDQEPGPTPDEEFLFFCSDRDGVKVSPPDQHGFFVSHRAGGVWSPPWPVQVGLDPDAGGCGVEVLTDDSLVFHSWRAGGVGKADIYFALAQ